MSYRAFKKLLGETSLERKCRFILGTVSLILITGSFWFYAWKTEQIAYSTASRSGPLLIMRTLYNLHDEGFKAREALNQFQADAEKRWPPTIKQYSFNVIKPGSRSPAHQPDPLIPAEAILIDEYANNPAKPDETYYPSNSDNVYYYSAVRAVSGCLQCHHHTPEEEAVQGPLAAGDLMAVIRIKLPSQGIEEDLHYNRALMISTALVTSVLIMVCSYLIVRYVVVKPVKHLKEVSDAIAAGEVNVRSEIQTGDEFEDLSYAFNRMLRNLMSKEDELKQANVDLDRKLDELAHEHGLVRIQSPEKRLLSHDEPRTSNSAQ